MHGDNLVAEHVVAWGDRLRDGGDPGVVVGDQLGGRPLLSGDVDAGLVNLDPLECRLVDSRAVIAAAGNVGENGTEVGIGPHGPLKLNGAAGRDLGGDLARLGVLVTDDISRCIAAAVNKAIVQVLGRPRGNIRNSLAIDLGIVEVEQVTLVVHSIGHEAGDEAMGQSRGGKSADERNLGRKRHGR